MKSVSIQIIQTQCKKIFFFLVLLTLLFSLKANDFFQIKDNREQIRKAVALLRKAFYVSFQIHLQKNEKYPFVPNIYKMNGSFLLKIAVHFLFIYSQ